MLRWYTVLSGIWRGSLLPLINRGRAAGEGGGGEGRGEVYISSKEWRMTPIYPAKGHYLILLCRRKCEELLVQHLWFTLQKKKQNFFSPSLMSYLLCTCLPLLIPQLLNNHISRRKNHDECNTQKQFMAIFNLPFGFLSPWDSFCSYFQGFHPSNQR